MWYKINRVHALFVKLNSMTFPWKINRIPWPFRTKERQNLTQIGEGSCTYNYYLNCHLIIWHTMFIFHDFWHISSFPWLLQAWNYFFQIPWLFQVFHDHTNPDYFHSKMFCVGLWEGKYKFMWPALAKQGTSHKAQVSDFTCSVAGINMINTL